MTVEKDDFDELLPSEGGVVPGQQQNPDEIPVTTSSMDTPSVFADAVWFAANLGNVVRIQFIENHLEPQNARNSGLKARHVGTLIMPRIGFKNMIKYLQNMDTLFDEMDRQLTGEASNVEE